MIEPVTEITLYDKVSQELGSGFSIFSVVFLLMILIWNIQPKLPHLPGDSYLGKSFIKIYILIPSSLIVTVALYFLLGQVKGISLF